MVISGINHGANLGENVYYSGTVGAAREGALHHIPSIAMSLCSKKAKRDLKIRREWQSGSGNDFEGRVAGSGAAQRECAGAVEREVRFTRQSQKITRNQLSEGKDPRAAVTSGCSNRESTKTLSRIRITRQFFPGRFHHAAASGSNAHGVAESPFALGKTNRRRIS